MEKMMSNNHGNDCSNGSSKIVTAVVGQSERNNKRTRESSLARVSNSKRSKTLGSTTQSPVLHTGATTSSDMPSSFPFGPLPLFEPINETDSLKFLMEKKLTLADVNSNSRIVIPKKQAEKYLPTLDEGEIPMMMKDADGLQTWLFKWRVWPNISSRVYGLVDTRPFLTAHNLQKDDYAMLYKDVLNDSYVIRARKAFNPAGRLDSNNDGLCEANAKILPEPLDTNSPSEYLNEYEPFDPLPDIGSIDSSSADDFFGIL